MRRLVKFVIAAVIIGFALFWWLSSPANIVDATAPDADADRGEIVFWAGGCASCHAAKGAEGDQKLLLGGGHRLKTPFGTFVTPNISPDVETGIGNWNNQQFANAMFEGVSPQGKHYYPSFPYTSYNKMNRQDVADLFAYLRTLPPVSRANEAHELPLPFQWRRPLGIWKLMFAGTDRAQLADPSDAKLQRGRYLVEALGHCGECHTPRNLLGGPVENRSLAGGPAPEGEGKVPNITPHADGIGGWSAEDIAYYLESGFTPDFDSAGGSMVAVQQNMARLPKSDLEAIAAYLKSVPPVPSK